MRQTLTEWNGLTNESTVKVKGHRGQFRFRSATIDESGECAWVTLIGGTAGHSQFRHFRPETIIIPKMKRQRKL